MVFRLGLIAAFALGASLASGQAHACAVKKVVTMYWSAPPTNLAADEIVVDAEYLGDHMKTPSTMSTSVLTFRVNKVVAGSTTLPRDSSLFVVFEARCRTLMVSQPKSNTKYLLVGKIVHRGDQTPLIEPRYRACSRADATTADGKVSWTCPLSPGNGVP